MNKTGRKGLLTPETTDTLLRYMRLGLNKKDAAALAGLDSFTLNNYLRQGHQDITEGNTTRYSQFCTELRKAEAEFKASATAALVTAAQSPQRWQAAAWLLERRFPDEYGRQVVEVSGRDGGPLQVEHHHTADELIAQVRALRDSTPARALGPAPTNGSNGANGRDHA